MMKQNGLERSNVMMKEEQQVQPGCECCNGDEALFWRNNENNAFVDSKGEVFVTVSDRVMRFHVNCCPNCGRRFAV